MAKSLGTPEHDILRAELAALRHEAGFTQRGLAEALGVPHSWVAKVETGERRLDMVEFCWLCQALGRDPAAVAPGLIRRMLGRRQRRR